MASSNYELKIASSLKALVSHILNNDLYGRKIYLIGSSEYGPTNEPIKIKSTVGLYNRFGKSGTLIDAFHAIKYTTKENDVYLVKTTGEHSIAYLNTSISFGNVISNSFILISSESNEIFNDIQVIIDPNSLTLMFPQDLNVPNNSITYDFKKYYTVGLLAEAINEDTKNKRSYVNANYSVDSNTRTKDAFYICNPDSMYLYGGQCGLNYSKNLLYTCLETTYDILESFNVDIVIPVDAFIDDLYPDDSENSQWEYNMKYYQPTKDYLTPDTLGNPRSFMNQLIEFCRKQLNFGMVTTGILGFNPINTYTTDYLYESDFIADMYIHCLEYNRSLCLNEGYGFLVSVVGGDIQYNKGDIIDNGYLAYGAFNASIQTNIGNTNKPVSDNIKLYNEFSEDVLYKLASNGIVTFRHSPLYNKVVVYDGITAVSRKESQLSLYCNVRMIQMCIAYLNQLFQSYIGHNMVILINKKIVDKNIRTILETLVKRNVITKYSFELTPNYNNGTLTVNLKLLTNYMTKSINVQSVIEMSNEGE